MKVMQKNTRLLVLTGVHGELDGSIGGKEDKFVKQSKAQIKKLEKRAEAEDKDAEDVDKKNLEFKVEDVGEIVSKDSKTRTLNEDKFVEAVKNFDRPRPRLLPEPRVRAERPASSRRHLLDHHS